MLPVCRLNPPHQKLVEDSAICKTSPSHTYVFSQTQVLDLVLDPADRYKNQTEEICHVMSTRVATMALLACSPPSL